MSIEAVNRDIRALFASSEPLDRDEVANLLLDMLDLIRQLEATIKEQA